MALAIISPARRAIWELYGIPIIVTVNDERCLAALDHALRFAMQPGTISSLALHVTVLAHAQRVLPPWHSRLERLWSSGRYHLCRIDGDPVVWYEEVAWSRLFTSERRIVISGDRDLAGNEFLLTQQMFMPLLPPALRCWGLAPLHACAVDWHGRAVVFPAVSGSGKSTLALALLRGGFRLLSDDMPVLRRAPDGAFRLLAFPEPHRISPSSLDFFPDLAALSAHAEASGPKVSFDPTTLFGECYVTESRPVAIIVPRIAHASTSQLQPLAPALALHELIGGTAFGATGTSSAHFFPLLADFVSTCQTFSLATGTDFDTLPTVVRGLLATID